MKANITNLTSRNDVDAAIETLTQTQLLLGDTTDLAEAKAELLALRTQLHTGDTIVVENASDGFGFVTHHYELLEGDELERHRALGHTNRQSVVALAQRLGFPVVLDLSLGDRRVEWLARTLREAGVVAITEMED